MTMSSLVPAFVAARMGVGALSWASPSLAARVFGLDLDSKQPIVTQLFGAREFGLAVATATTSGEERRRVLALGVAIDSVDFVACVIQMRKGAFSTQAKLMTAAGAATFALAGAAALAATDR